MGFEEQKVLFEYLEPGWKSDERMQRFIAAIEACPWKDVRDYLRGAWRGRRRASQKSLWKLYVIGAVDKKLGFRADSYTRIPWKPSVRNLVNPKTRRQALHCLRRVPKAAAVGRAVSPTSG